MFKPDAYGLNADYTDQSGWLRSACRVFSNGVIEIGTGFGHPGDPRRGPPVASASVIRDALRFIGFASQALEIVEYHGRTRIFMCLDHTFRAWLELPSGWLPPHGEVTLDDDTDHYEFSEDATVDTLATNPLATVRPLMDSLWNIFGYDACKLFLADGSVRPDTARQLGL